MYEQNCQKLNTAVIRIRLQRDKLREELVLLRGTDDLFRKKVIKAKELVSLLNDLQTGIRKIVFSDLTAQSSVMVKQLYGYGDRVVECHTVNDKMLSSSATGNKYVWVKIEDEPLEIDYSDNPKVVGEMELVQAYQLFPVARARMMRRFRESRRVEFIPENEYIYNKNTRLVFRYFEVNPGNQSVIFRFNVLPENEACSIAEAHIDQVKPAK